jgi:hypothetical protein
MELQKWDNSVKTAHIKGNFIIDCLKAIRTLLLLTAPNPNPLFNFK